MKKFMVADLVKHMLSDEELKEIDRRVSQGMDASVAAATVQNKINWPLDSDNDYQWWVENQRPDIEYIDFNFAINPSRSSWGGNMKDSPASVDAEIIWESIGNRGDEEAIFSVNVDWPKNSTSAPRERTYEMTYSEILAWSQNTSGTYFNANIRGKFAP